MRDDGGLADLIENLAAPPAGGLIPSFIDERAELDAALAEVHPDVSPSLTQGARTGDSVTFSGGENVYSAEVEDAVHGHAAVAECAVIGIPDDKWGERVHAIVRLKDGAADAAPVTADDIMTHCHTLIAGFKCPRSVDFRTDPLPLSGAGKILKTDLRKPYWQGHDKQVS